MRAAAALAAVLVLAGCGATQWTPAAGPVPPRAALPRFTHVVVVVFENRERDQIVGNPEAPTFNALLRSGADITRYDAVTHPSLPNYLALVSGSTHGITSDCTSCDVSGPSLASQLEAAGRTWKTYAEGLPRPGWDGSVEGLYAKKHDPFLYFRGVDRSRVVPLTQLAPDVAARRLPDFSLVVPDLCNDMHDCFPETSDRWLRAHVLPLLRSPALAGGVVFVVFDEGTSDAGGGGHIYAAAAGPAVRPGSVFAQPTNHYGLLRTIEDAWGLPRLGLAARARPIAGIWK